MHNYVHSLCALLHHFEPFSHYYVYVYLMSEMCMALCRRQNALAKGGQAKAIESGEAEGPEVSNLACHPAGLQRISASWTVATMHL